MIDFNNFKKEEANELFSLIQKSIEKSELEKFYLFTQDNIEKAKIFVWCHRFLCNVYNLIDEGKVKTEVKKEIDLTKVKYSEVLNLLNEIESNKILVFRLKKKLFDEMNKDSQVDDLIDAFSVLIERDTISSMAKLKGFILEGKSGKEFKKIFSENKAVNPGSEQEEENFEENPEGGKEESEQPEEVEEHAEE